MSAIPEELPEPEDLYALRASAHALIDELYAFLYSVQRYTESPGVELWYSDFRDCDDPSEEELAVLLESENISERDLCAAVIATIQDELNEAVRTHQAFTNVLEPLEEELSQLSDSLEEISGHHGRSVCAALDSFAYFVIRWALESLCSSSGDDRLTFRNWLPCLRDVANRVQAFDLETFVHEAIEVEADRAWDARLEAESEQDSPQVVSQASPVRTTAKRRRSNLDELEALARKRFGELRGKATKKAWADSLGCDRETVGKLRAWKDADNFRKGLRKVSSRLRGLVDPRIIDALNSGDVSALTDLPGEERDKLANYSSEARDLLRDLIKEQSRDDVS